MKKITTLLKRLEARTLLWTNPNPNASFTSQNVSLPNVYNVYDYIEVEYKANSSQNTDTGYKIIERTPCHSGTTASLIMCPIARGFYCTEQDGGCLAIRCNLTERFGIA